MLSEHLQTLSEHPGGQTSLGSGTYRRVMILDKKKNKSHAQGYAMGRHGRKNQAMPGPAEGFSSRKEGGNGMCGWSLVFPIEEMTCIRRIPSICLLPCRSGDMRGAYTQHGLFFGHPGEVNEYYPCLQQQVYQLPPNWVNSSCLRSWAHAWHHSKCG